MGIVEVIPADAAIQDIAAGAAHEAVVTGPGYHDIVPEAAIHRIIAVVAEDAVVPNSTQQSIGAGKAADIVVAGSSKKDVRTGSSVDHSSRRDDGVRPDGAVGHRQVFRSSTKPLAATVKPCKGLEQARWFEGGRCSFTQEDPANQ